MTVVTAVSPPAEHAVAVPPPCQPADEPEALERVAELVTIAPRYPLLPRQMIESGEHTMPVIARSIGVGRVTLYRHLGHAKEVDQAVRTVHGP